MAAAVARQEALLGLIKKTPLSHTVSRHPPLLRAPGLNQTRLGSLSMSVHSLELLHRPALPLLFPLARYLSLTQDYSTWLSAAADPPQRRKRRGRGGPPSLPFLNRGRLWRPAERRVHLITYHAGPANDEKEEEEEEDGMHAPTGKANQTLFLYCRGIIIYLFIFALLLG